MAFLATPGGGQGTKQAKWFQHRSKGMGAINAGQTSDRAAVEYLKCLTQARLNTRVGFAAALQELAQTVLLNHHDTGQISAVVGADTTLGTSAGRAAEGAATVASRLTLVEAELGSRCHLDRTALDDASSVEVGDQPVTTSAKRTDSPSFGDVFCEVQLPSDETDQQYLARIKSADQHEEAASVSIHKWIASEVAGRSESSPKEGTLLRREKLYGMSTWRPSYFVCRRFAFIQINNKGTETVVCQNLRGASVKKHAASIEMPRHYMFSLRVAEFGEPIFLQASCLRELTEWTTSLQKVIDGGLI